MDLNNNESINNQIENLIQNEFNSTNYDANVNYSLNQLTQFINSSTQDCLINSSSLNANNNENNLFLTTSVAPCQNDLDQTEAYSNDNFALEAANNIMNDIKSKPSNLDNNIESEPFSFSFLSDDVLSTSLSPGQPVTKPNLTTKENISLVSPSDKSKSTHRFNYKCKYCTSYSTKFKAHILEHMQQTHNVYLMQCPDAKCSKRFKDEWKLKRHLSSNHDHQFKSLNDIMKPHVEVSPQKDGFACPLCFLDSNQTIFISNDIEAINSKKLDNNLYFDKFDDLKEHIASKHANLDMSCYFICKDCGQVFQNKCKLKCHQFNVHSGKRKSRTKAAKSAEFVDALTKSHIKDSIESVLTRYDESQSALKQQQQQQQHELDMQKLKITCVTCSKKFKRIRDINIHIKIMHKNLTDSDKQQQEQLFAEHKKLKKILTSNKHKHMYNLACIRNQLLNKKLENNRKLDLNNKTTKVCFVCSKVLKLNVNSVTSDASSSINTLNKAFTRHMQIQHGLNEKGERLLDCPVCEKSFFNRQQMERHMHTHEVWVELKHDDDTTTTNSSQNESESASDFRDKHSILYCHECVECKIYFKSIKVLTRHKRDVHHLKPVYKCANTLECNQDFDTVASFLDHSKIHPQRNIVCSRCKNKFENKNSLRHHMKNVHYNRKLATTTPQTPAVRPKKSSGSNLSQTIRNLSAKPTLNNQEISNISNNLISNTIHSISKALTETTSVNETYCCPTCKKCFASRNALHNHLATHNTNELRLFLCNTCGHSFKTRKDLSRHASLHDASKHKTCQECGMTFKTSFHLKRHSLTRHSDFRPFKCNHCEMTFARKDKLKQHEAKHINHPLYQCAQCSKGFYRKEHLKDHEISKHSKQYPFSCEHCSKGFVHAKDLHRHIRVRHLGLATVAAASHTLGQNLTSKSTNLNTISAQLTTKQNKTKSNNIKLANSTLSTVSNANLATFVSPSSNDFKSKKISSILKSNLVSSAVENNISTPTSGVQITPHSLVIDQPAPIPVIQHSIPILATATTTDHQLSNQTQIIHQQPTQQYNILFNSNDKSFLILNNDFQSINIINDKANQLKFDISPTVTTTNQVKTSPPQQPVTKSNISNQQYLKSFKCNVCSKDFFYENHLRKHILSKHTKTPLFACSFCNQGFSTKSTAKSHVENSHVSYVCPVCSKSFKTKSHCVRHISSYHNSNANAENLNPKRVEVDAKLVDFSSTNMNMLNLISIDNSNNTKSKSSDVTSASSATATSNLKNLTNSSNLIVCNQPNQLIQITAKELRDVFAHNHSIITTAQPNQGLTTFLTNPLLDNSKLINNNQNQNFIIAASNRNSIQFQVPSTTTSFDSSLNYGFKQQQQQLQRNSPYQNASSENNSSSSGNDLISIDSLRFT